MNEPSTSPSLDQGHLDALAAVLSGPGGASFIRFMARVSMAATPEGDDETSADAARDLGLLDPAAGPPFHLTPLGWKVADSLREYFLWIERGRSLHREGRVAALDREQFRDAAVLEIGSGFGCNLFTLQTVTERAIGLEKEPLYVRLTPLLAAVEGVATPRVETGMAEAMPFDDETFDIVVAFGSLQYMRIPAALREAARVLRRGGRLLATMSSWRQFVSYNAGEFYRTRHPGPVLRTIVAGVNFFWCQYLRATYPLIRHHSAMNDDVYPTHRGMRRLMRRAGLTPATGRFTTIDHETVYVAYRN